MMVSTKTTTQINTRMVDCNVTGVFADVSGRAIIGQF